MSWFCKKITSAILAIGLLTALLTVHSASAKEPYAKFLRALQENGYGDVALEYIEHIEKLPDFPPEMRETLDLERSNSFRAAAGNAYDARQAEQYLADAQKYLDKFLKEHPGHPAAASSILFWGDLLFERGQRSLALARHASEPSQKTKLLAAAREHFKQAGVRYEDACNRFLKQYEQSVPDDPLPDRKSSARTPAAPTQREQMEVGVVQSRFKMSLVKFHIAQTFDDPKSSQRLALLKEAAKGFNDIYQQYRINAEDERCIVALLWHGQTLVELGDEETALDVFDEVLPRDTSPADSPLAPIFSQATFFRYSTLRKQGKLDELINEASKWVESRKSWGKYPYYNGAALELAKAYQEQAERTTADTQRKNLQKAVILLAEFSKNESPYRSEMLLLRRDLLKKMGTENVGAAELLALGDAALSDNNLPDAQKYFEQALQKSLDAKDQKAAGEAKQSLGRVAVRQAHELFEKKQYAEALRTAEALAQGDAADPNTTSAAQVALWSAYSLGATSPNKEDAYAQLEKVADFVKNKWPGRPVADDARMILAQSRLQKRDTAAALLLFSEVKPESSRYPRALFNIGRIQWINYLDEKKKGGLGEQPLDEARTKALESLQKCRDLLKKSLAPGRKLPGGNEADPAEEAQASQLDTEVQLLQSEIYLEKADYQEAVKLLDPLVQNAKTVPTKSDDASVATFINAIRAHLGLNETERAADIAVALLAISDDDARSNAKLASIARLINEKLKTAETAVADAQSGEPKNLEAVTAKRDALKAQFHQLIEPLAKRKNHSLPDLVFLGNVCFNVDLAELGGQLYQTVLDRAKDDPAFSKESDNIILYIRSQLIGVLRSQGKLEEALKQADELVKKHSNTLPPMMKRAEILDDLARQDPKKLEDAILQWNKVRLLLNRENPKRPEYFEVVYNLAKTLYWQYEKSKDQTKLVPAEQLLKTTLVQSANLSGPDMVARYNELLKRIQEAKGKK